MASSSASPQRRQTQPSPGGLLEAYMLLLGSWKKWVHQKPATLGKRHLGQRKEFDQTLDISRSKGSSPPGKLFITCHFQIPKIKKSTTQGGRGGNGFQIRLPVAKSPLWGSGAQEQAEPHSACFLQGHRAASLAVTLVSCVSQEKTPFSPPLEWSSGPALVVTHQLKSNSCSQHPPH